MFIINEITRLTPISDYYVPTLWPFVVSFKFWYGASNEEIAEFWRTTFSVLEPLTQRVYITGVVYERSINYSSKRSLDDCKHDAQSFFWDGDNQTLYIHLNHLQSISGVSENFSLGLAVCLTADKIRYFDNRVYYPYLLDYPEVEVEVDKFNYDQLAFLVETLKYSNKTGFFNQFKTIPLYGNKVVVKTGSEGDKYEDLVERATFFVEDYNISASTFSLDIQDIRKTQTAQIPNIVIDRDNYPDAGNTSLGKVIPFGYNYILDVEGLCLNEEAVKVTTTTLYPTFIFLSLLTATSSSDIEVWVKDSDAVWQLQNPSSYSIDLATYIVTIPGARTGTSGNFDVLQVKANVTGVLATYASDIIKDLNFRFLGVVYDDSAYDTAEWEVEEKFLAPISFFMNETKDIYSWIKELQSASSVGFRYTTTPDNRRTIRCDNPNREPVCSVPSIDVKNPSKVIGTSDIEEVWNQIYIGYNKSILKDTSPKVKDLTYYDESSKLYNLTKVYTRITGLLNETDARNSASIQSEDYAFIRLNFDLTLIGKEYASLRLYDILNVDLSLTKKKFILNNILIEVLDIEEQVIEEVLLSNLIYDEILRSLTVEEIGDEYFGLVRGQIISIKPNYKIETNAILLRERPYSVIWEEIYDN